MRRTLDTLVVFENYPLDNAARTEPVDGLRLASIQGRDVTHYPLSLKVIPREQLCLRMDYDPVRFEHATAEAIGTLFVRLLHEAVAKPMGPLHRLEILSPQEKHRILKDLMISAPSTHATLPQLFEERVEQSPDATALIFGEESLSYQELDSRADRLTAYLRNRGVGTGTRVGICIDRSLEMIVGMLGILKAGGVYVPLDPTYPAERHVFILNEIAGPVILTIAEVATSLPSTTAKVICLDRDSPLIEDDGTRHPRASSLCSGIKGPRLFDFHLGIDSYPQSGGRAALRSHAPCVRYQLRGAGPDRSHRTSFQPVL